MKIRWVIFLLLAVATAFVIYWPDRSNRQWKAVQRNSTQNMLVGAAEHGDLKTMQTCLDAGASVQATPLAWSPLDAAVYYRQEEATRFLLDHGANPNGVVGVPPPLFRAIQGWGIPRAPARLPVARLLLERGADPNLRGGHGETPLSYAKLFDDPELVLLLQQYGAHD